MTEVAERKPVFPGGTASAPEAMPGGCAHPACSCVAPAGQPYCCRACARAGEESETCACGHHGCTADAW